MEFRVLGSLEVLRDNGEPVAEEAGRLELQRHAAHSAFARVEVARGRHADVLPMLADMVDARPLDEGLCALFMVALYRCGRQADGLEVFRKARSALRSELGIEPGPALQAIHTAILRGEDPGGPDVRLSLPLPSQQRRFLPRDLPDFTGRSDELARLDAVMATGGAIIISGIAGAAGVGKTALAVHWAHQIASNFPDGQLFVNLRGFDPRGPIPIQTALSSLLKALGIPPERIPSEPEEAMALYRAATADQRLLVVIDDARSAEHVRHLLPTGAGSVTVVTSRDSLAALAVRDGARLLTLSPMPDDEAMALLEHVLGAERVARESATAAELSRLCGNLPLALRIAAANLLGAPGESIAAFTDRLRRPDRLARLAVDGDAIEAVFDQSYAALTATDQRVFRLLGLHLGPDITAEASAELASVPAEEAVAVLHRLTHASLLTEVTDGRFQLHDLVKLYATRMAEKHESEVNRARALAALLDFYLMTTVSAAAVVAPHTTVLTTASRHPQHVDAAAAMGWLHAEQANLAAAVMAGPASIAWRLADALRGYYWIWHDRGEWIAVSTAGMKAAIADDSVAGQAAMHIGIGNAFRYVGQLDESFTHLNEALRLSCADGWADGEIGALAGLGAVHTDRGDKPQAIACFEAAARLNEGLGRTAALAVSLSNIGGLRLGLGELAAAATDLAAALDLFRATGNRVGEAVMYCNLGLIQVDLGVYAEARELFQQAITAHQEVAHRDGETVATLGLADLYLRMECLDDAIQYATRAIDIAEDIDSPRYRAIGLIVLGHVHRLRIQPAEALALGEQAVTIARKISMRFIETDALDLLAQVKNGQGLRSAAHADARQALAIAEAGEYQSLIAKALTTLTEIHLAAGEPEKARHHAQRALDICAHTGIQQCVGRLESLLARMQSGPCG